MRQLKITKQFTNRDSQSFASYLAEVSNIPLISAEEEVALSKKIQKGDVVALQKLVDANLRFVISVAKQYSSQSPLPDLVQEGNLGLMIAAQRFDSSKGFKFISYAVWWIRQSIMQYISDNGRKIRLPLNKINVANRINSATSELEQLLHRSPTSFEISEYLTEIDASAVNPDASKFTNDKIDEMIEHNQSVLSLDAKISSDEDSGSIIDLMAGEDDGQAAMNLKDLGIELGRLLNKLPSREKDILTMHFGLFGQKQTSLEEIGVIFGLSRERVRQIRENSLKKLKLKSHKTTLREYR